MPMGLRRTAGGEASRGMFPYDRRIEQADVTVRFPIEWLANSRGVNDAIAKLLGVLKPGE
jgi:hypothetical protein